MLAQKVTACPTCALLSLELSEIGVGEKLTSPELVADVVEADATVLFVGVLGDVETTTGLDKGLGAGFATGF